MVTNSFRLECDELEIAYNTVINSGHNNRYYGVERGSRNIGSFVFNTFGLTEMYCHRDSDHSNYETYIIFPNNQYSGKTLKVYGQNDNLLYTFTINGTTAYADRHKNDPLGIKPAGVKYYNLVIE